MIRGRNEKTPKIVKPKAYREKERKMPRHRRNKWRRQKLSNNLMKGKFQRLYRSLHTILNQALRDKIEILVAIQDIDFSKSRSNIGESTFFKSYSIFFYTAVGVSSTHVSLKYAFWSEPLDKQSRPDFTSPPNLEHATTKIHLMIRRIERSKVLSALSKSSIFVANKADVTSISHVMIKQSLSLCNYYYYYSVAIVIANITFPFLCR